VWTEGPHALIRYALPHALREGERLSVTLEGKTVHLNNRVPEVSVVSPGRAPVPLGDGCVQLELGRQDLTGGRFVELLVEVDGAVSPAELGVSMDARKLGYALVALTHAVR